MSPHDDRDDLIQSDIDGTIAGPDRARLSNLLASDAAARDEHRRLSAMRDLLATVPAAEPPASLRSRILRSIRAERAKPGASRWNILPFWPGARVVIPYAYAAAAGAAIAIVGLHLLPSGGALVPDAVEREAAATIGSAPAGIESGRLALTGAGVTGSATLRTLVDGLAVDVDLPADGPLDVQIGFDPASVKVVGVSNRLGGIDHVQVADGTVRWSQSRPQRVTVFVVPRTPAGSKVEVRFSSVDGVSGGGSLDLPGRS